MEGKSTSFAQEQAGEKVNGDLNNERLTASETLIEIIQERL
jgi:hypothetical protein